MHSIYTAPVFAMALFWTIVTIRAVVMSCVEGHKSIIDARADLLMIVIASILWGLFYYLTR